MKLYLVVHISSGFNSVMEHSHTYLAVGIQSYTMLQHICFHSQIFHILFYFIRWHRLPEGTLLTLGQGGLLGRRLLNICHQVNTIQCTKLYPFLQNGRHSAHYQPKKLPAKSKYWLYMLYGPLINIWRNKRNCVYSASLYVCVLPGLIGPKVYTSAEKEWSPKITLPGTKKSANKKLGQVPHNHAFSSWQDWNCSAPPRIFPQRYQTPCKIEKWTGRPRRWAGFASKIA